MRPTLEGPLLSDHAPPPWLVLESPGGDLAPGGRGPTPRNLIELVNSVHGLKAAQGITGEIFTFIFQLQPT